MLLSRTGKFLNAPSQIGANVAPIVEQAQTATAATSLTLTLANGAYRDLLFLLSVRAVGAGGPGNIYARLNAAATNYAYIRADNGVFTALQSAKTEIRVAAAVATAAQCVIRGRLSNDDTTGNMVPRLTWQGSHNTGAGLVNVQGEAEWNSAATVTSLTFGIDAASFAFAKLMAWGVK